MSAATSPVRIAVDAWAPEMGAATMALDQLGQSPGAIDAEVEVPVAAWRPLAPSVPPVAGGVAFVDGVRRIEANLWVTAPGERTRQAIAASIGAGAVRCEGPVAEVVACEIERLLVGPANLLTDLATSAGPFVARPAPADDTDTLRTVVQERLRRLERRVLDEVADADLVVVDGPLDAGTAGTRAVGYVKTHHVAYLRDDVAGTVADLEPGTRTPLFLTTTSWTRFSWYLRLPGAAGTQPGHPWAGVVRCEASADFPVPEVVQLADAVTATLPRFASAPHKDRRAPQNLVPIGGLERHLTHRLGDATIVLRSLRTAVA